MEKLKFPSIALGTWSWGTGAVGGDQVFGNNLGVEELKPVFDEAMAGGLNLWDSAVVYGMGDCQGNDPDYRRNETCTGAGCAGSNKGNTDRR